MHLLALPASWDFLRFCSPQQHRSPRLSPSQPPRLCHRRRHRQRGARSVWGGRRERATGAVEICTNGVMTWLGNGTGIVLARLPSASSGFGASAFWRDVHSGTCKADAITFRPRAIYPRPMRAAAACSPWRCGRWKRRLHHFIEPRSSRAAAEQARVHAWGDFNADGQIDIDRAAAAGTDYQTPGRHALESSSAAFSTWARGKSVAGARTQLPTFEPANQTRSWINEAWLQAISMGTGFSIWPGPVRAASTGAPRNRNALDGNGDGTFTPGEDVPHRCSPAVTRDGRF